MVAARKKELRLALVCYGGVSLAVYMHGITKELWKLLKASEAESSARTRQGSDTEAVWRRLLHSLRPKVNLRVICDVLAGASAGGINAVFLARAIASGLDLEPLSEMWLENADIEHLLDPSSHQSLIRQRLFSFYKGPIAWYAARAVNLASVDDDEVRADILRKMSHFIRARWFRPPFSGDTFTAMLADAAEAMDKGPAGKSGPALLPPMLSLDLYLTATDYFGVTQMLPVHSPAFVSEKEHRQLFHFSSPAPRSGEHRRPVGTIPSLVFAARATASFPGAFPAATVGEIDRLLKKRGQIWPDRANLFAKQLIGGRPPEEVALIDGSVLANAPFQPAIDAIGWRPVRREVDRRFVYIDPEPGASFVGETIHAQPRPGFFRTIYRALAEIPRNQPIRESLKAIAAVSQHVRRLGTIIDHVTPSVDRAIHDAVGAIPFFLSTTPEMLARARQQLQTLAVEEAGFAYVAYNQLKIRAVIDEAAELLADIIAADAETRAHFHLWLTKVAEQQDAFSYDILHTDHNRGVVRLLRALDTGYRIRRIRFLLRELRNVEGQSTTPLEQEEALAVKATLYETLGSIQHATTTCSECEELPDAALALAKADPDTALQRAREALAALIDTLDLSAIDEASDATIAAIANNRTLNSTIRKRLVRAWIGFPFYDTAIYPLLQETRADTFDELKVDRIAPDDATSLREGGARACLKGWQMNAFAGFFSRSYRENDYLWGRLHAAERLLDIVNTAIEGSASINVSYWRNELFRAILAAEEPRLKLVKPLIAELKAKVEASS